MNKAKEVGHICNTTEDHAKRARETQKHIPAPVPGIEGAAAGQEEGTEQEQIPAPELGTKGTAAEQQDGTQQQDIPAPLLSAAPEAEDPALEHIATPLFSNKGTAPEDRVGTTAQVDIKREGDSFPGFTLPESPQAKISLVLSPLMPSTPQVHQAPRTGQQLSPDAKGGDGTISLYTTPWDNLQAAASAAAYVRLADTASAEPVLRSRSTSSMSLLSSAYAQQFGNSMTGSGIRGSSMGGSGMALSGLGGSGMTFSSMRNTGSSMALRGMGGSGMAPSGMGGPSMGGSGMGLSSLDGMHVGFGGMTASGIAFSGMAGSNVALSGMTGSGGVRRVSGVDAPLTAEVRALLDMLLEAPQIKLMEDFSPKVLTIILKLIAAHPLPKLRAFIVRQPIGVTSVPLLEAALQSVLRNSPLLHTLDLTGAGAACGKTDFMANLRALL